MTLTDRELIARHDQAVTRLRTATAARTVSLAELHNAIRDAYRLGIPQGRIGALVGLTQPRISQIIADGIEQLT